MLKIDCLFLNTSLVEKLKKYVRSEGYERLADNKGMSFQSMYDHVKNELDIEIDKESFGYIYENELQHSKDERFTHSDDISESVGAPMTQTLRNLMVHSDKTGEQKIGDLSPGNAVAKSITDTFSNKIIKDERTKSDLKKMEGFVKEAMDRVAGELPEDVNKKEDKRTMEQVVADAIDKESLGHKDALTGATIGIDKVFDHVQKVISEHAKEIDDPELQQQYEKYTEDMRKNAYTIALSSGEAKKVVEGSLRDAGFMKTDAEGRELVDWDKLKGNINSPRQLYDNTVKALTKSGIDQNTAERVALAVNREHTELVKKVALKADAEQAKLLSSWDANKNNKISAKAEIDDQVQKWDNYKGFEGKADAPLIVSKSTAKEALKHVLTTVGLIDKNNNLSLDKISKQISKPADIKYIAQEYFKNQKNEDGTPKYDTETAGHIANAIDGMYQELFSKVREHVEGKQKAVEATWEPKTGEAKQQPTADELIDNRLKESSQYRKITGKADAPLKFKLQEAQKIAGEAIAASKEYGKNGKIDWQAMAENRPSGIKMEAMLRNHLLEKYGYSKSDAAEVAASITRDYVEKLHEDIDRHASGILDAKQAALGREAPERKMAIERLAQAHTLGIFDESREALLHHMLGIDKIDADDLQSLKSLSETINNLRNEVSGPNYLNSFAYQNADRAVAHLLDKNKENHSRAIKIANALNQTFGIVNMSLIANPYNLIENNWSGAQALMGAQGEMIRQMGMKNAAMFNDHKLWTATWKDVGIGGVEYGEGGNDKWSHIGGFVDKLNTLNFKQHPGKALLTSVVTAFRTLLNGSDAANKAVLHQKGFVLMLHKALMAQGVDKDSAANFIHEALYGENFDKARERARGLIAKYGDQLGIGKTRQARKRAEIRWANDLVKANLNLNAEVSMHGGEMPIGVNAEDIIEAALSSSFHAAALSLGHESNNVASRGLKAGKTAGAKHEKELLERGQYQKAAMVRMGNNIYYNGIHRMIGGSLNWAMLRAEGAGFGLLLSPTVLGDRKTQLDFTSKEKLEQSMSDRIVASRKITRAITGLTMSALTIAAFGAYGSFKGNNPANSEPEDGQPAEEPGAITRGMRAVKNSWALDKITGKAGPDIAYLAYLINMNEGKGPVAGAFGAITYANNLLNNNAEYTTDGMMGDIQHILQRGHMSEKSQNRAAGVGGQLIGQFFNVPLYVPYRQIMDIIEGNPHKREFTKPESVLQGALMGGFIQDEINNQSDEFIQEHGLENWKYKPKYNPNAGQ